MKISNIILMMSFLALSYPLYAAETGYEVELIIFEATGSHQLKSEDWSYNDMLNHAKEIAVTKNDYQDDAFIELDWQQAKLSDSIERIETSSKYNVLFKKRWRQTGLDRENAYAFDITSLQDAITNKENEADTETLNTSTTSQTTLVSEDGIPNTLNKNAPTYIQGRVKLIMSRYLHFEVNLNYYRWQEDDLESGYRSYPIVSERRMRSREIHYLDHPMVGVIVHALPFKIEPQVIPADAGDNLSSVIN